MVRKAMEIRMNGEKKTVSISKCMKALWGKRLDASQKSIFSKFMTKKVRRKDAKAFAKGFAISCELDEEISKLHTATFKAQGSYLRKRIRRLETKLTPAKKKEPLMVADQSMPNACNISDKMAPPKTSVPSKNG